MSEAKFTKGEWRLKQNNGGRLHLLSSIGAQICAFWNCKERNANANLIACAPEMYKLLRHIQIEGGLSKARHVSIDKLLAKARGEQND